MITHDIREWPLFVTGGGAVENGAKNYTQE